MGSLPAIGNWGKLKRIRSKLQLSTGSFLTLAQPPSTLMYRSRAERPLRLQSDEQLVHLGTNVTVPQLDETILQEIQDRARVHFLGLSD